MFDDKNIEWKYCVIGNIVRDRIDENGELRHGCKEFKAGTKVYLSGKFWSSEYKTINVIGLDRHHKYRVVSLPAEYIEDVRFSRVFKPSILCIMNDFEFSDTWWDNTPEDAAHAKLFVEIWNSNLKHLTA